MSAERLKRYGRIAAFFLCGGFNLFPIWAEGAPTPYFGNEEGRLVADPIQRGTFENLQAVQFGGETIGTGGAGRRLFLFSWERDFILESPTLSFLNVLAESDETRLTFEFPAAINPYFVLIGEYPGFYRFSDDSSRLKITRFRGGGVGAGVMKRGEAGNFRVGTESVAGELKGEIAPDRGWKTIEFIQLERDRTQKGRFDEPTRGGRLFFSAAASQFRGFASQSSEETVQLQGIEEGYGSLSKGTTLGLIAREGRDFHPGMFWRTTFGSFQEDAFNVPLPGYSYQRFSAPRYLNGEGRLRSWVTEKLLLHLGYYAAGGWSGRIYTAASLGMTYLFAGKFPLMLESGRGLSRSGAGEFLAGTALEW